MVDAERLDLVEREENADQEHLVLLFQREGKAIDDTGGEREREERERDVRTS